MIGWPVDDQPNFRIMAPPMQRKRVQFAEEETKGPSQQQGVKRTKKKIPKDHGRTRSVDGEEDASHEKVRGRGPTHDHFFLKLL